VHKPQSKPIEAKDTENTGEDKRNKSRSTPSSVSINFFHPISACVPPSFLLSAGRKENKSAQMSKKKKRKERHRYTATNQSIFACVPPLVPCTIPPLKKRKKRSAQVRHKKRIERKDKRNTRTATNP
jgi:hypothetical protein